MRIRAFLRLFVMAMILATVPARAAVNQEMLDRVASGELSDANASWWGFEL